MASESKINLDKCEEEAVRNQVSVRIPSNRPLSSLTFDKVNQGPGIAQASKTIYSKGLINISLLSANASQLRKAQSNNGYEHQTALIVLISTSIVLQAFILLLLCLLTMVPRDCETIKTSRFWGCFLKSRIKSAILFFVSILTAVNIFISVYQNVGQ